MKNRCGVWNAYLAEGAQCCKPHSNRSPGSTYGVSSNNSRDWGAGKIISVSQTARFLLSRRCSTMNQYGKRSHGDHESDARENKLKPCNSWFACVSLVLAIIFSNQAGAADTVALVSDVSGNVVIKTDSGSSSAKLLGVIPLDARIDLPEGAKLVMIYVSKGDEYRLSGPGSYRVGASSPQTISGNIPVKQASLGGALSGKRIRPENVAQATLAMRGGIKKAQRSLQPLTPSGSITLADPLQLQWREPKAGLAYKIQLMDSRNKALINQEVTGNTFTLPQEIQLSSGGYYVWKISATTPDGSIVAASAKFRVASQETRTMAAKLRPGKNGTVSERVVYGLWLEAEDLINEARMAWKELDEEFPGHPNLFDRAARWP